MSSSFLLDKRRDVPAYRMANFTSDKPGALPLGGWEDSYIINGAVRECRSGFESVPIGKPGGFEICRRKCTKPPVFRTKTLDEINSKNKTDYHKFSPDLYNPGELPRQISNPDAYHDRKIPNEGWYHSNDYLARSFKYNGTGVIPSHVPSNDPNKRYYMYGYSYGACPPPVYDITRLEQPQHVYAEEMKYLGQDPRTIRYRPPVTSSTF